MYLFTSEVVSPGHPDKCADIIADSIVDEGLHQGAQFLYLHRLDARGRNNDSVDALRFAVFKVIFRAVVYRDLSFDINAQFIGISFGKFINLIAKHPSVGYGCWHILVCFAASKAKHYALIPCAYLAAFLIDALIYIRALLIYADFYLNVVWV